MTQQSNDTFEQIAVQLRLDQLRALERLKPALGRSRNQMIRDAVDEWLIRHSPGRKAWES